MYNEDVKNKFIAECINGKSGVQRAIRLFNSAETFESSLGKDICAIPSESLVPILGEITSARTSTQVSDLVILRKYAKWCLNNNIPGACGGLLENKGVGYGKIRDTMVSGPEQLDEYLNKVFPSVEDCRLDNLCRGSFWLSFIGFDECQFPEIRTENIDLKRSVIRFNEKSYEIYDEAIPVIRYLCTANSFFCDYGKYDVVVPRDGGTQILRGIRSGSGVNTDSIGRLASKRISEVFKKSGDKITLRHKSIRLSGVFYRMYEDEMSGQEVSAEKYFGLYFSNMDQLDNLRIARKAVEFETDYQRWKIAFDK